MRNRGFHTLERSNRKARGRDRAERGGGRGGTSLFLRKSLEGLWGGGPKQEKKKKLEKKGMIQKSH